VRPVRAAFAVTCLVALFTVTLAACGSGDGASPGGNGPSNAAQTTALNTPFTAFDGTSMRLSDLQGKPAVVNFFASWCTPCVVEMPEFERVHRAMGDAVTFVGLNSQDTLAKGRAIANQTGVTYLLGTDPDDTILTAFDPLGLPITVLLRADGTVAEVHQGQFREDTLTAKLRQLLGSPGAK
jgi:thiol-disulfide isomerase/thioredoxin